MVGTDSPSKVKLLGNENPNSTTNKSGGQFSIYPQSKTQRSPASLYRFNKNYVPRRHPSTNITSGGLTEKPASFMTALSQIKIN